jgi:transketolase
MVKLQEIKVMLEAKRDSIKIRLIKMYKKANAGHVGSSLSCLEIATFIKFELMKQADELILSKGHAAALLYRTCLQLKPLSFLL